MKTKMKCLSIAVAGCLFSSFVHAWGQTGHRVTGEIAEQYLSPAAASQVATILPNESLAEASTWPDEMRSNPDDFWQDVAGPFHYVTVPAGKTYNEVGAPEQGDSVTALTRFRATLLDESASHEDKQLALRFIVHIIGDLHQPLHAGNGTDRGGNDVKVRFFGDDSNLHRVWDTALVEHQKLSYTEWTNWLVPKITTQEMEAWHSTDPSVWIGESTVLRDGLYPEDANRMSWQYIYDHTPTIKQRLTQGGVRIALYLNELFAEKANNTQ